MKVMAVDSKVPAAMLLAADMSNGVMANGFLDIIDRALVVDGLKKNVCRQSSIFQLKRFLIRPSWPIRTLVMVQSGILSGRPFVFVVSVAYSVSSSESLEGGTRMI